MPLMVFANFEYEFVKLFWLLLLCNMVNLPVAGCFAWREAENRGFFK